MENRALSNHATFLRDKISRPLRRKLYRFRGYLSGSLNDETFRFDPENFKFWRKASAGTWEPETFGILDRHLDPEHDYLDIGAWIGQPCSMVRAKPEV